MMRFLMLALLLAACIPAAPITHDISGSLAVHSSGSYDFEGTACTGKGGYADVAAGTGVTVKDQAGAIIGSATLGTGSLHSATCTFPFTVKDVPAATFYSIEVGHRGALNYSAAEMKANNWTVSFTLGA